MKQILVLIALISTLIDANSQRVVNYTPIIIRGQTTGINDLNDGNTSTGWFPGWNPADYPVRAMIELDEPIYLTNIKYYDSNGKPELTIKSFESGSEKLLFNRELSGYNIWTDVEIVTTEKVQYLIIEISNIQAAIPLTELMIIGVDQKPTPPNPQITKWSGDARKIGTNGFDWVPTTLIPCHNIRLFQESWWTWTGFNGQISTAPLLRDDQEYDR